MVKAPKRTNKALRVMAGVGIVAAPPVLALSGLGATAPPAGAQGSFTPTTNSMTCDVQAQSVCTKSNTGIQMTYTYDAAQNSGDIVASANDGKDAVEITGTQDGAGISDILALGNGSASYPDLGATNGETICASLQNGPYTGSKVCVDVVDSNPL